MCAAFWHSLGSGCGNGVLNFIQSPGDSLRIGVVNAESKCQGQMYPCRPKDKESACASCTARVCHGRTLSGGQGKVTSLAWISTGARAARLRTPDSGAAAPAGAGIAIFGTGRV